MAIGPEDDGAQADGGSNELVGDGNGRFQFADPKQPSKAKRKEPAPHRKSGKKYLNIKLVDFGARARASSSIPGGKAAIRGDAFLSLLLFESDGFDMITTAESKSKKVYRGGSRGAFEDLSKLGEGDVVALLNPKILKPFQVRSPLLRFCFANLSFLGSAPLILHIPPVIYLPSRRSLPSPSLYLDGQRILANVQLLNATEKFAAVGVTRG